MYSSQDTLNKLFDEIIKKIFSILEKNIHLCFEKHGGKRRWRVSSRMGKQLAFVLKSVNLVDYQSLTLVF